MTEQKFSLAGHLDRPTSSRYFRPWLITIAIIIIFININIVFVVMCYETLVNEEPSTSPGTVSDWTRKKYMI